MNTQGKTILVIDSEQGWLEFAQSTLKKNHYEAYAAQHIEDAQALLATHSESQIVLVLIDSKLIAEHTTIIGTLRQSETGLTRSVVVVFPTDLTPRNARDAFKQGAADCVSKPYDEASLLALVEQMLADHRIAGSPHRTSARISSSHLLIIDDDTDWQESLMHFLPQLEQTVRTAADYRSAAQLIQEQSFDLVIADLRLVDADDNNFQGMDLVRLIREKDLEREIFTQIILVSAYGTPEHIREAYRTFRIYYYFDKRYLSPSKYREAIK